MSTLLLLLVVVLSLTVELLLSLCILVEMLSLITSRVVINRDDKAFDLSLFHWDSWLHIMN